jgi:hypothetical protein
MGISSYRGAVVVMIVWFLDLQLLMQSIPITIKVASSNPAEGEVYSIPHYVIKFVSNLQQVDGFLRVFRFPPPTTHHHHIAEILLKVTLNTINQTIQLSINNKYTLFQDVSVNAVMMRRIFKKKS